MGNRYEPTPEQVESWKEWLAERPEHIAKVAALFPPWELFRMKSSGHRVFVTGLGDTPPDAPAAIYVAVVAEYNKLLFERRTVTTVDDLEPCDMPGPDEELGAQLDQEQAKTYMALLKMLGALGEPAPAPAPREEPETPPVLH